MGDIRLDKGESLAGILKTPSDIPITSASIQFDQAGIHTSVLVSMGEKKFIASGLVPGPAKVRVNAYLSSAPRHLVCEKEVIIVKGKPLEIELVLVEQK